MVSMGGPLLCASGAIAVLMALLLVHPTLASYNYMQPNRWHADENEDGNGVNEGGPGSGIHLHHDYFHGLYSKRFQRLLYRIRITAMDAVARDEYGFQEGITLHGERSFGPAYFQRPANQSHLEFSVYQGDPVHGRGGYGVEYTIKQTSLIWRFHVQNLTSVRMVHGSAFVNFTTGVLTVSFKPLNDRLGYLRVSDENDDWRHSASHQLTNMDTPLNRTENGMDVYQGVYSAKRGNLPLPLGINYGANERNFIPILQTHEKLPFNHTSRWNINATRLTSDRITIPLYQGYSANASNSYYLGNCTIPLTPPPPSKDNATELILIDITLNVTARGGLSLQIAEVAPNGAQGSAKPDNSVLCRFASLKNIDMPVGGEEAVEEGVIDEGDVAGSEDEEELIEGVLHSGAKLEEEIKDMLAKSELKQLSRLYRLIDGLKQDLKQEFHDEIMFNRFMVILLVGAAMTLAVFVYVLRQKITSANQRAPTTSGISAGTRVEFSARREGANGLPQHESLSFNNPNWAAAADDNKAESRHHHIFPH